MAVRFTVEHALQRGWISERPGIPDRVASQMSVYRQICDSTSPPHEILYQRLFAIYGAKVVKEFSGAVPGRRFRVDIALPDERLAIEVDGWQHHGKTLKGFKRDRLRQNLLCINGWRVLRFFPASIYSDMAGVTSIVAQAVAATAERRSESETALGPRSV